MRGSSNSRDDWGQWGREPCKQRPESRKALVFVQSLHTPWFLQQCLAEQLLCSRQCSGKDKTKANCWTRQGRKYREPSDRDNGGLGPSLTQVRVLTEQTRKRRLREGERLPKVTQQVFNF